MNRFLEFAQTGRHAAASTGEGACTKLLRKAPAIARLLEDVDRQLAREFFDILLAASRPDTRAATLRKIADASAGKFRLPPPAPPPPPPAPIEFPHSYPGITVAGEFQFTSDCAFGCGCWMGSSRSGGPDGVDPFGECPKNKEGPTL